MRKLNYLILIIVLLSCIFFSFTLTTSIQSENSIRKETNISLKTSVNEKFVRNLEFRVNYNTTNSQIYPSICVLSDDTFAVAWQSDGQDGSGYGIYARVFNADTGHNITSEFRVNNYIANNQMNPSICALSDDTFAVAWQSNLQDGDLYGIYARVFNATMGHNITSEFPVNKYTTSQQEYPSICALSNDTFVVTWKSFGQDGDAAGIYARVFNATTGNNITSEFQVNNYTVGYQEFPSICALSDDTFAVTWQSLFQDGDDMGIYASVFNASTGHNITSEFRVNNYIVSTQKFPFICALSNDTFAVTWQSYGQDDPDYGIYARVFNATTGNNITSEFRVNNYTTSQQEYPSICALSDDTFAVTWQSDGQDGDAAGIYARVFNATTGNSITSEFQVNSYTTNIQEYPSICALSNDTFAVAWDGKGQDDDDGIYATVFGPSSILPSIIIPTSDDDDDDDDDDNVSGAISGYDLYVLFVVIGLCTLVLRRKIKKN